ncbi:hypothetical protein O0881_25135 [Janthinobacterium sp. SUN100]|uniref:hypothetical protein n=1 Tax=Janthinobacterium sp. SUN100 TaxID=3004101 RepID=UPI0025B177C2|nr:hypothetical protein [Janthinobacterium sp. SUN100]MDN2705281.1 hypothetical protein [Janthinobacterium sp. SUN100]
MTQASADIIFASLFMPPPKHPSQLSLLAHAAPDASAGNNLSRLYLPCAQRNGVLFPFSTFLLASMALQ